MRVACLAVLLLAAVVCQAQLLTFQEQGSGVRTETLVLMDGRGDGLTEDSRLVGMIQQYDLSSSEEGARQSFTIWPSSAAFVDGGWQTWVDQQLTVLDSLQSMLVPRCPHAAAAAAGQATPPQSDYPSLLSYMASSRFGPSILTAYARQVDQDVEPAAFGVAFYGDADEDEDESAAAESADESAQAAWGDAWAQAASLGADVRDRFPSLEEGATWFGPKHAVGVADSKASATAATDLDDYVFASNSWAGDEARELQASAYSTNKPYEAEADWSQTCNLALFLILCIGCIVVWIGLVRAWVSCCRLEQQAKAAKKASTQHFSPNPLLCPLIPEGADDTASNPAFAGVIASEHLPRGTYFSPQGTEYVSIAYEPLHAPKA